MTVAARKVLTDCEVALEMLENEEDLGRWRVYWAGALALLRAVGHVLYKVDGDDPTLLHLIDAAYNRWKTNREANAIFWEFIEKERNNILKEYRFNIHPIGDVDVVLMTAIQHPETGDTAQIAQVVPICENIYRPITDGFREGDDARDVYREALDWWDSQLMTIEGKQ